MSAIYSVIGWVIAMGIELCNRVAEAYGTARAELAGDDEAQDLPPCGMRVVLTDEQVAASIADLEKQFPKNKTRRIR